MKIVDLSIPLAHAMPRYPSPYLPDVELRPVACHEKEARSVHVLSCGTHVSTHIDAPYHMVPDGKTLDQIPLSQLFGKARILRFAGHNKNRPLEVDDFRSIKDVRQYRKIVLDTGWASRMWGTKDYFTEGPHLTREAAIFLSHFPLLHLIGMDFPNVDSKAETIVGKPAPNHAILLTRGIVLLENLVHLERVDDLFVLSAMPPRLIGADGCPCRAVAFFPWDGFTDNLEE